jgi:hypothetical protein
MTRVNRADTLLTELRDLERRIRLLEAARMRQGGTAPAAAGPTGPTGPGGLLVPLLPVRPVDWPATTSAEWERLASIRLPAAGATGISLDVVADPGTSGAARVLAGGVRVGEDLLAAAEPVHYTLPLPGIRVEVELEVEGRVLSGGGAVRVAAALLL